MSFMVIYSKKKGEFNMTNKYLFNPDFNSVCEMMAPLLNNEEGALEAIINMSKEAWENNVSDDVIKVSKYEIPTVDNATVEVHVMEKNGENQTDAPCLVYYHGGGWVIPILSFHLDLIREYITRTSCKVVCVDYRIAPEFPFPIPFEDCYSTLQWTADNAEKIGINPNKIVLGGDSAGGNFTAAVSQKAVFENGPKVAGQMLIYPAVDVRMETESMKKYVDTPVWNGVMTEVVYQQYLQNGDCGMRQYASPMEAESFVGLPKAYIEVAEFDCLRDEGLNYAEALKAAGVDVTIRDTKGTVHAFDYIPGSEVITESLEKRAEFLQSIFNN